MPIAELASRLAGNRLHVIIFGPGYGESIAVHIPNGGWLICDSLSQPRGTTDFIPAAELLSTRRERAGALVLTHPHDDHVGGFDRLITRFADGPVGLVGLHLPEDGFTEYDDAGRIVATSNRVKVLAAISDHWQRHPERRWELTADQPPLRLGPGLVTILHPNDEYLQQGRPDPEQAPNAYSTPMLIEWERARVVLGADLPTRQWKRVLEGDHDPELSTHAALKIPHHGSTGALPEELVRSGDRDSIVVLTPWHLGRGLLPKLGPKGGLSWLLERRSRISLTSPGRAIAGGDLPTPVTLNQFTNAVARRPLPGGVGSVELKRSYDPDEAWVAVTFTARGDVEGVEFGRDACLIVERELVSQASIYRTGPLGT
jgi:hypothetical protein